MTSSYATLPQLPEFQPPVYVSSGLEAQARELAFRFQRAYHFFSTTFTITPTLYLALLSARDWPRFTHSPFYGAALYDYPQRTIVAGAEPTTFWHTSLDLIRAHAPALLTRLRTVYPESADSLTLAPHTDLWLVHDLGHAFHLHQDYWFPRKWLMECFANLCLYTYIAVHEPQLLPIAETFLLIMHELPAHLFSYQTLDDFEKVYSAMDLNNYLWYLGHFMWQARELYTHLGVAALTQFWQFFVSAKRHTLSDTELAQVLISEAPALGAILLTPP